MTPPRRRLRIFVAHPSEMLTDHLPHGDGLVSFGLIHRLVERGHELHVAAQGVDLETPIPRGLHIHQLVPSATTAVSSRLLYMMRLRVLYERLRRREPFDVIHQMNPVFTGLTLSLLGVDTPLVLGAFVPRWGSDSTGAECPPSFWGRLKEASEREVAKLQQAHAAGLLIASPQALSRIHVPSRHQGRIFEVPHGIDVARFMPRTEVPARPSVLFLTSVQYRKGIFTLLDAFEHVAREMPEVELVIAGDGPALPEVRQRAAAMAGCRITFAGKVERDRVASFMRSHSVYCLPSIGEPFGMTIVEAMACGVPVVATRAGGVPDLVSEPGGRLVPPRDPLALAEALLEVLRSPTLQRSMGLYNRARVERVFDIEKTVDRLEDAYSAIIAASSTAHPKLPPQAHEEAY